MSVVLKKKMSNPCKNINEKNKKQYLKLLTFFKKKKKKDLELLINKKSNNNLENILFIANKSFYKLLHNEEILFSVKRENLLNYHDIMNNINNNINYISNKILIGKYDMLFEFIDMNNFSNYEKDEKILEKLYEDKKKYLKEKQNLIITINEEIKENKLRINIIKENLKENNNQENNNEEENNEEENNETEYNGEWYNNLKPKIKNDLITFLNESINHYKKINNSNILNNIIKDTQEEFNSLDLKDEQIKDLYYFLNKEDVSKFNNIDKKDLIKQYCNEKKNLNVLIEKKIKLENEIFEIKPSINSNSFLELNKNQENDNEENDNEKNEYKENDNEENDNEEIDNEENDNEEIDNEENDNEENDNEENDYGELKELNLAINE